MNRPEFFNALRKRHSGVFGTSLGSGQVQGTEALLDAMEGFPLPHAAHVLAEVYHETGAGMLPVKETVMPYHKDKNPSDATVISRLDAWARKIGRTTNIYWRDGWFGRGQIQITHEDNYRKASALTGVSVLRYPAKTLDLSVSSQIAALGCQVGMFTSKKLSDFDGDAFDHYNARAIVNGDKGKNGRTIAGYALAFESALLAGGWMDGPLVLDDTFLEPPEAPKTNLFAALIAAILKLFTRK